MCNDKNIKELLPAYRERGLDRPEQRRVEVHLESCGDCRVELSLLRMMADEPVPDPGEAFWAAMPGRMERAVQEHTAMRRPFDLSRLADRLVLPRWGWAAATVGVVLLISLFTLRAVQRESNVPVSSEYEFIDEILAVNSSLSMAELSRDQIDAIDTWAGSELVSIAQEAAPVVLGNVRASDIEEELADLNAGEIERLSTMLEQEKEEG